MTEEKTLGMALKEGKRFDGSASKQSLYTLLVPGNDMDVHVTRKSTRFNGVYHMKFSRPQEAMSLAWILGGHRDILDCTTDSVDRITNGFSYIDASDIRYFFLSNDDSTRKTLQQLETSKTPSLDLGKLFHFLQPLDDVQKHKPSHSVIWSVDGEDVSFEYYDPKVVTEDHVKARLIELYEPIRLGWIKAEQPICLGVRMKKARQLCDCSRCKLV